MVMYRKATDFYKLMFILKFCCNCLLIPGFFSQFFSDFLHRGSRHLCAKTVLSLLSQFMSLLSPFYHRNTFALGLPIQCQVAMVRCSWLFRSYEESFKFLTIKCDVRCRYFEDLHQDLQDVTLHSQFAESFFMNECQILSNAFYAPIDMIM